MKSQLIRAAVIGAIVGFLGFGGVTLAQAQTPSTTTPKTTQPGSPSYGKDDPNCPNMGGSAPSKTPSTSSGTSTSPSNSGQNL
ncbi:MAG: hypothetical protein JWN46_2416 [Acidimicrobiales bacterium]|nr:hypothetical protein [Acidimicrobiales bacterium]